MGAVRPTGAIHHGRGQDLGLAQHFQSQTGAHDIHNGIDGSHLVKVHLFGGVTMNFAFRARNPLEYRDGFRFHPIRIGTRLDELADLSEIACRFMLVTVPLPVFVLMMMPMMVVVMRVVPMTMRCVVVIFARMSWSGPVGCRRRCEIRFNLLRFIVVVVVVVVMMIFAELKMHFKLCAHDAALPPGLTMQMIALDRQLRQGRAQGGEVHAQVQQRPQEHVAANTAGDIQINCFHVIGRLLPRRLISRQGVDLARRVTGPKTVVNVHHSYSAAATV